MVPCYMPVFMMSQLNVALVALALIFLSLLSSSIRKKGKYVSCKLLYFIFTKKMSCDLKVDIFIHQPTLSWNEVYCFLQKDNLCIFINM
jgi:hypothetical protein